MSVVGTKEKRPVVDLHPKCPHLGADNRCMIYDKRPKACRVWVCHEDEELVAHMRRGGFPTHAGMLKRLGLLKAKGKKVVVGGGGG